MASRCRRGSKMTTQQEARIKEFQNKLVEQGRTATIDWTESDLPESRCILFAEVDGITLMVYPDGLISIPAVRTYHPPRYPTPIIAAASTRELWTRQKARDDSRPGTARIRKTGHLDPIVHPSLKCRSRACRCQQEGPGLRQKRARGGFNTNPDRCS